MAAVQEVAPGDLGFRRRAGHRMSRATAYRRRRPRRTGGPACVMEPRRRPAPPRALSAAERAEVLQVLRCERFVDASPAEAYHTLLDEGVYLASERTMYRLLAANWRSSSARRPACLRR